MKRIVAAFALALSFGWLDVASGQSADQQRTELGAGPTLSNQSLPVGLRYSVFASYLIALGRDNPTTGVASLREYGLPVTVEELQRLASSYGDFDVQLRGRLDADPANNSLAASIEEEREQHIAEIFGGWLDSLRSSGYDTDVFLRNVAARRSLAISMSFGSGQPSLEQLERRSRAIEARFSTVYGKPIHSVLGRTGEQQ